MAFVLSICIKVSGWQFHKRYRKNFQSGEPANSLWGLVFWGVFMGCGACWHVLMIGLGEGRISDKLQPVFCVDKASGVLWFEATHEMESFNHLVAKVYSKKGCVLEEVDRDFCLGHGPLPIHVEWREGEPLRRFSSSSLGFSHSLIWRLWELWHGPLWNSWVFLHLSRLRQ